MFSLAIPIFADGKDKEMNYHLVLKETAESLVGTTLYITAFSFYRLTINGSFLAFGPARAAAGYARVDEIDLSKYDNGSGNNEIIIEAVGYYCCSFSTVKQSSFVVAELRRGDNVILYTGRDFKGYRSAKMIQKTERYSGQRHFGEIHNYPLSGICDSEVSLTPVGNTPKYLPRHVHKPNYDTVSADECAYVGEFLFDDTIPYRKTRYSFDVDEKWGRYEDGQVFSHPYRWIQRQALQRKITNIAFPIELKKGDYAIVDMGRIEAGFLRTSIKAEDHSDVVVGFSEMSLKEDFEFTRMNAQNVLEFFIEADNEVEAESFEPYTCRFAIVLVKQGKITLKGFSVRTFEYPEDKIIKREIKDALLAKIYKAGERTFCHNAVDLYTDCPSRERAGWLCDSFFTGRAEYFLTGATTIEDAFLENYRLYPPTGEYPEGVLPMCYPSDCHVDYIPQWNMWYILEVEEYINKRNKNADKELFRDSVYGILDFLSQYENKDGLLQNLPGWNFVEWSTANEWVQDVNYPTNFLYAEVLRAVSRLYKDSTLLKKASLVAKTAEKLSFDGEVFIDNAVIDENGMLQNTHNSSEAGQYYAILFGEFDLNDEKYKSFKKNITEGFTGFNTEGRGYVPVNAFIGLYLRVYALMKLGEYGILEDDIKSFFGGMADATGTLWEYKQHKGSYDHGFTSFITLAIDEIEKIKNNA